MDIGVQLHSIVRYAVLVAALIGLTKAVISLVQNSASDKTDSILSSTFLWLFDVQAALGVLIILQGGLRGPLHPLLMFVALVIAHVLGSVVKRAAGANINLLRLAFYIVPLAIILFGLLIIGQLRI